MLRNFKRVLTTHGFPGVVSSPGDEVAGEVFFIRPPLFAETLKRCDILEEIPLGQLVGPYYRRAQVTVETIEGKLTAWAYVDPEAALENAT